MTYIPGSGGSGGGGSIATSSDVALNNPADGNLLSFNGSTGKWTNTATTPGATQYTAVIFYNSNTNNWPARSTVGDPLTVEWRGPDSNKPPIDSTYAKNGYDTFYAIS